MTSVMVINQTATQHPLTESHQAPCDVSPDFIKERKKQSAGFMWFPYVIKCFSPAVKALIETHKKTQTVLPGRAAAPLLQRLAAKLFPLPTSNVTFA